MAIIIQKSTTADTRSCDFANVTKIQLEHSSRQHINDVSKAIDYFVFRLRTAAYHHDADKLNDIDHFHSDFIGGFKETGWWDAHRKGSRHHLLQDDGIPADVNLIDVLEMIADCVMAGMGRTGNVYPLNISPDLLKKAMDNTTEMLKKEIVVEDQV